MYGMKLGCKPFPNHYNKKKIPQHFLIFSFFIELLQFGSYFIFILRTSKIFLLVKYKSKKYILDIL